MVGFSHLVGPGSGLQQTAEAPRSSLRPRGETPGRLPGRGSSQSGGWGGDKGMCRPRQEGEEGRGEDRSSLRRGRSGTGLSDQTTSLWALPGHRPRRPAKASPWPQNSHLSPSTAAAVTSPAAPPSCGDPWMQHRGGGCSEFPRRSSHGAGAHKSHPQDRTQPLVTLSRVKHGHQRRLRGQEDTPPGHSPCARRPGPRFLGQLR